MDFIYVIWPFYYNWENDPKTFLSLFCWDRHKLTNNNFVTRWFNPILSWLFLHQILPGGIWPLYKSLLKMLWGFGFCAGGLHFPWIF